MKDMIPPPARLAVAVLALLVSTACETVNKKEWAITQSQVTRIDERVAKLSKTLAAQADFAASMDQMRNSVSVMTGQIEEFNGRAQMLSDRMDKLEKSVNGMFELQRSEMADKYAALNREGVESRKELQAMSAETRAMTRAMEGGMASIESRIAALDGAVRELGQKKEAKPGNDKGKKEEDSIQKEAPVQPSPPAKQDDPAGEWDIYERAYTDFIKGDNEAAARRFLEILEKHPDSSLADDSLFWLGESFFAMDNFQKASEAFAAVWDRYPSSVKAGAALLQCAESLIRLGRVDDAVIKLKTIANSLPGTPEAAEATRRLRFIEKGAQGKPAQ